MNIIRKIQTATGIDKAIIYQSSGVMIGSLSGIISLLLIAWRFSADEQGVYYTFTSIAALQVFFELGLTGIIVQYAAHEYAHLQIGTDGTLNGPQKYISRLSSLLHLFVKWYFITAAVMVILLLVTGFLFFSKYNKNPEIHWQTPWVLLCFGTSAFFLLNMFLAFLEGCGQIRETSKIRTIAQAAGLAVSIPCLYSKYGLYALGLTALTRVVVSIFMIYKKDFHRFFPMVWNQQMIEHLSYWREIFPYQWKIALSWLSGYFIFNLFNPVLFAFVGAKAAGQMGLTMAGLTLVTNFSMCWINTKIPVISALIATKDVLQLNFKFSKTLKQVSAISGTLLLIIFIGLQIVSWSGLKLNDIFLRERFLGNLPLLFMSLALYLNIIVGTWAIYLRCHKEDPYVWLSLISGICCGLSTFFTAKYIGMTGMTASYFILISITTVFAFIIYQNKKSVFQNAK